MSVDLIFYSLLCCCSIAYSADPAVRWGWPDSERYAKHFPSFVRAFGGIAFTHGSAYYVDGYAAAAPWLTLNVYHDEDKLISLVQCTVSAQIQKDFFPPFEQIFLVCFISKKW